MALFGWRGRRRWRKHQRQLSKQAWHACCKGNGACPTGGCPLDRVPTEPLC